MRLVGIYRHEVDGLRRRFTNFAAIGLAAAAVESVLDAENSFGDLEISVELMLDEVWRLPARGVERGLPTMTERQRDALPSARLYRHMPALLDHCAALGSRPDVPSRASYLANGALANLMFAVWLLDGTESVLNPGKPPFAPGDIAETNWTALVDGLERLTDAARDPRGAHEWQRRTMRRLAEEHPAVPDDFIGTPLGKAFFGVTRAERDPSELDPLPSLASGSDHRLPMDAVEDRFTDHAAIALATATIERLVPAARKRPELGLLLSGLVEDLWSWQAAAVPEGWRVQAGAWPSYRFYRRVEALRGFAETFRGSPRLRALVDAAGDAVGLVA